MSGEQAPRIARDACARCAECLEAIGDWDGHDDDIGRTLCGRCCPDCRDDEPMDAVSAVLLKGARWAVTAGDRDGALELLDALADRMRDMAATRDRR